MSSTVDGIALIVLAVALVGGAVGMLTTRNILHAGYWLLELSVAAAGVYYLLDANYLALVQLLVYAGAVSILIIFSIMLTLRRHEDALRSRDLSWQGAALAVAFGALVLVAAGGQAWPSAEMPAHAPDLTAFGSRLFAPDGWALPFEIVSAVLTSALVGAVWWARKEEEE